MFQIPCYEFTHFQLFKLAQKKLAENPNDWEKNVWNIVEQFCNPATSSLTFSTSGSTGTPKLITAQKNHLQHSAKTTVSYLQIAQRSNTLLCLPAEKIGGAMVIVRAIVQGLNLICIKPTATPLEHLAGVEVQFASFTPMQFFSITQNDTHFATAQKINTILIGGSEVNHLLLSKTKLLHNHTYATYGMTETLSHIALKRISHEPQLLFKPLPGVELNTDTGGALVITAHQLGIHHLPTNDLVKLHPDQSFEWLGRKDNIINTGGLKVIPEELEEKLQAIIPFPFFIAGKPHEKLGQMVVIVVEKRHLSSAEVGLWQKRIEKTIEPNFRPRQFWFAGAFIRTTTGKVIRHETIKDAKLFTE